LSIINTRDEETAAKRKMKKKVKRNIRNEKKRKGNVG
jgi:hypothetical protein